MLEHESRKCDNRTYRVRADSESSLACCKYVHSQANHEVILFEHERSHTSEKAFLLEMQRLAWLFVSCGSAKSQQATESSARPRQHIGESVIET